MDFNDKQKEGIARYLDTVSAASLIGGVAGTFGEHTLPYYQIGGLIYICVIAFAAAVDFRKGL